MFAVQHICDSVAEVPFGRKMFALLVCGNHPKLGAGLSLALLIQAICNGRSKGSYVNGRGQEA